MGKMRNAYKILAGKLTVVAQLVKKFLILWNQRVHCHSH
jgi:hypothetical protein